ncbi:MAG: flavin reductase family protein [Planctomycetota bacterium]
MNVDPQTLSTNAMYHWMVGLIAPRPIAWVSTRSSDGVDNLAPFSFFNGVGANPPSLMFCPVNDGSGNPKDSLVNVRETGVFAVNLVTESVAESMNQSSHAYPSDVDEFDMAMLEKVPCQRIAASRVAKVAACFECEMLHAISLGHGPGGANLVVGKIVHLHVDDAWIDDGRLTHRRLQTIGRMGGSEYVRTTDRFEMSRPIPPSLDP